MTTSMAKATNPVLDQDRVFDLVDTFDKYGCVMFHQQRRIYEFIAERVASLHVLEAGCGSGVGTAILERKTGSVVGTDKSQKNVDFARQMYPWIRFETWNINNLGPWHAPVVVCVEVLEHIADGEVAIENLLASAQDELWISTPNRRDKTTPPENPYHVQEYTPQEMLSMLGDRQISIRECETWNLQSVTTSADPLLYHIRI